MNLVARSFRDLRDFMSRFGPQVRVRDGEFLEAAREIIDSPPSPVRMTLAIILCCASAIAIIAASIGRVDIYAVAPGRILPVGRTKVVQPLEDGKVNAIHVREGSRVRTGDVLVDLDATVNAADRNTALAEGESLEGEVARRDAEVLAARRRTFLASSIQFPSDVSFAVRERESAVLRADLDRLRTTIDTFRSKIVESIDHTRGLKMTLGENQRLAALLKERLNMRAALEKDGWETRANVLEASEDLQRTQSEMTTLRGQIVETQAETQTLLRQVDEAVGQFIADNANARELALEKLISNTQSLTKASAKLAHMHIVSPTNGTVQQLEVTTIGQVVTTGQQLMTIVPSAPMLEVEALVQNADIGFVHEGQLAVVKVDSFPFTRYGTLRGRVVGVAQDAVTSPQPLPRGDTERAPIQAQTDAAAPVIKTQDLVYSVRIALDRTTMKVDGKVVRLDPGMSVSVEISTGKRSILSYILAPVVKTIAQAGHER